MGSRAITYFVAAAGVKLQLHLGKKNQFGKSRAANACKATEENTFLETSKRREVIKFFALKH